jgi:hypothetical protein
VSLGYLHWRHVARKKIVFSLNVFVQKLEYSFNKLTGVDVYGFYQWNTRIVQTNLKHNTRFHLALSLRMHGAIPPNLLLQS